MLHKKAVLSRPDSVPDSVSFRGTDTYDNSFLKTLKSAETLEIDEDLRTSIERAVGILQK